MSSTDRGEPLIKIEPLRLSAGSPYREELNDLALAVSQQATAFQSRLPPSIHKALSNLVRSMNCYYSNLIEGHHTHPVDIERALQNNYSNNPEKRNLQKEAKAHITVQAWIDQGGLHERTTALVGIREVHQRFCELLPEELLQVKLNEQKVVTVVGGEFRQQDVQVGRHVAISAGSVERFMQRFEQAYSGLGKMEYLLATAAAHHRLLWIHPFLDGNGRVARLMSHAMLLETLNSGGIWSIARGFARQEANYKMHLANCDLTRRNDLDGRGYLSEESLVGFTRFFLETCLDQITFMQQLVQPEQLQARILNWVSTSISNNQLPNRSERVLEALLYKGRLARSEIPVLLDISDRQARRVVAALTEEGILSSESSRAPLELAFPAKLAEWWMPGLFPEQVSQIG